MIISARVNITVPLGERQKRDGAKREAVENSLAASSAKITSQPVSVRILGGSFMGVRARQKWAALQKT